MTSYALAIVKHIINSIKEECPRSKCLGIYCYMPEESAYRTEPKYCEKDLGIPYLTKKKTAFSVLKSI